MTGLPTVNGRGRRSATAQAAYDAEVEAFCDRIKEIASTLDFRVSARGWAYILEGQGVITKGDFDAAEKLINDPRKSGLLPLDVCAVDGSRAAGDLESLDDDDTESEALTWFETVTTADERYIPISFWETQDHYVEVATEKVDLKSLFNDECARYRIPITNIKGWCDINARAAMMLRFKKWERRGKKCVLLYCGDHDPGGLAISGFLMSNLADLKGAVGWDPSDLTIERFGLDYEFIEANNLTWIDNLETSSGTRLDDPRHKDHLKTYVQSYLRRFGARKVEANALVVRPTEGRQLCRDAIGRYVSEDAIEEYEGMLSDKREELKDAIARLMAEGAA